MMVSLSESNLQFSAISTKILSTSQATKTKMDKWNYSKLQIFCVSKDIINRTKRQRMEWEEIFTNHI